MEGLERCETLELDATAGTATGAFLRRTAAPHASLPTVVRVDILDAGALPDGRSRRFRRFFALNAAPAWLQRLTGLGSLVGTEEALWEPATGRAVVYTANESHAHLIKAEVRRASLGAAVRLARPRAPPAAP